MRKKIVTAEDAADAIQNIESMLYNFIRHAREELDHLEKEYDEYLSDLDFFLETVNGSEPNENQGSALTK